MVVILGLEGTAWNLSAALVTEDRVIYEAESAYKPIYGGIHPREAAQHHASELKRVVSELIEGAKAKEKGFSISDIDGVAFSQGPGMGPCLRTVATAARALALTLKKPLIGVNHCIAHIEIGRWQCGVRDPVVLYVSGANSQVLAYHAGRYRILGETLDIGIGNALDKFARYMGLSHPGGPKIEELASRARGVRGVEYEYIHLPYVVKGMDFSFSGLTTAAKDALDAGHKREAVCYSFQETAFAMLTEVTERAMAYCGKEELLLAGGVGANRRLQQMLRTMCQDRSARFFVPETRYLRDNGTMIAYLGLLQFESGQTIELQESAVKPNFRPDEVEVRWRN
ncbi:MAG: bifunctional N(6)-L-threonylcarbamoyladenine synthase/serine/threonine protein kinase [Methanophagales archaeon]|nr:bifunctional N(6)-L-threonylcarbamoyladenine synthase/serine/threonine protein kinase [Methanophagales archaeon]MCW3139894.1 bifunctional N(6)-L-threonylcarbamoyladenine synthase/serine/threonine protein kinase [Methanophagales archaeon]MCW7070287.1 bifunctional N(6)-L-threonylcarbamoyladenine synthase/serine/threonine protein kinase [Methanophagales archaeon]MCW7073375.1 bifunctional N(6)-L-threonylcarbamoyladenine synthase/serine/threonine protein kinase [Methanophagales archaeon]RLG35315.